MKEKYIGDDTSTLDTIPVATCAKCSELAWLAGDIVSVVINQLESLSDSDFNPVCAPSLLLSDAT